MLAAILLGLSLKIENTIASRSAYLVNALRPEILQGATVKLADISQSGIRFAKMDGRPLQLNERIRVSFSLNNYTISCVASVYSIRNEVIGAKFIDLDEHSKKVLGFFLLP